MVPNGARRRSDEDGGGDAQAMHGNPLGLEDLPAPSAPRPWRWLGLAAFVLLSLTILATLIVVTAANDKKTFLLQAEERRLEESVTGRVNLLETWLEGQHAASRRLTDSQVFKLFVTDLAMQKRLSPLPRSLQDQRPYFRQLMADVARQNNLVRAAVLRADGATLLSSAGPALPVADILHRLENAEAGWRFLLSAIRHIDDHSGALVVDAVIALPRTQAEDEKSRKPAAMLVLTLPLDEILEQVLSTRTVDPERERIVLLQQRGKVIEKFSVGRNGIALATDRPPDDFRPGGPLAFGRRDEGRPTYSFGEPVNGVPWTLYHALDARATLSPVHDFVKVAAGFSALAVIALAAAFSALWWRQGRNHHRYLVDLYKTHAHRNEQQRQFLDSITRSIGDWLSVSSPDGNIIYANPAFEAVIGTAERSSPAGRWDDLVKELPAAGKPEHELISLIDADRIEVVEIGAASYCISPKVSDLRAEDGSVLGTVRVIRDHTALASERRRRLQAMAQTVDAFIHAIELRDPFLVGHTDRLRTQVIAMGRRLDLPRDELAALALAASLSQIGKIFIPDDILAKPERHSAEEGDIMRNHILHAVDILRKVDFELPIVDTVAQMHERLDGSGYPHGLAGDQIGLGGRILGVADVFCARTAPRSYRDRMSAGKTLYHLASNERRYDLKVVAALADTVDHGAETPGLDAIERSFVDAGIWQKRRESLERIPEPA